MLITPRISEKRSNKSLSGDSFVRTCSIIRRFAGAGKKAGQKRGDSGDMR